MIYTGEKSIEESVFDLFGDPFVESSSFDFLDYITEAEDNDEDDTEYSLDNNEEQNTNPATPANDEPGENNESEPANEETADDEGDTEYSLDDNEENETTEDNQQDAEDTQEQDAENTDDEYELPDENETSEEGEEQSSNDDGPPADDGDVDYSMDGETPGGEEDSGDEGTPDDSSTGDESADENSKMKDLESVIFDELNPEEKKLKIKELKDLYTTVYQKCGTIAEKVADIKKDEQTIQIVEYISNTLVDLKQYILDYTTDIFDSKTYVENLAQLQKYLAIFNAINKVFAEIRSENE